MTSLRSFLLSSTADTRKLVIPDMADTTTTFFPSSLAMILATLFRASTDPTLVPPNFITVIIDTPSDQSQHGDVHVEYRAELGRQFRQRKPGLSVAVSQSLHHVLDRYGVGFAEQVPEQREHLEVYSSGVDVLLLEAHLHHLGH